MTKDRGIGHFQPHHTPPDVCAAQDVALDIVKSRNLSIRPPPARTDSVAPPEKKKQEKKPQLPAPKKVDDDYAVKAPPPPPPSAATMRPSAPSSRSLSGRAASPKRPFSSISTTTTPPEAPSVEPPPPPPARRERTGKGRIGPVRASELANLAVNAEGLDPIRQEPRVRMEYLSKGKWYEVTGGRPPWAEDERERVVAPGVGQSTRRTRASPGKYAL